jgi:hypothetical protein
VERLAALTGARNAQIRDGSRLEPHRADVRADQAGTYAGNERTIVLSAVPQCRLDPIIPVLSCAATLRR